MTLVVSGTLRYNTKLQYLCTIICVEALRQFDDFFDKVGSTTTAHLNRVILVLGTYFSL